MDLDKLIWKEADGLFSLTFDNERGLSRDEIEEIFSEFGYVVSVSGDDKERGCRFVHYQSHGDARYALDSLKDHPFIKFREQLPRNQVQKRLERQRSQQSNAGSGKRSRNSSRSSKKESDASVDKNRPSNVRSTSETTEDDNGFEFEYRRNRANNKCKNGESSEETSMPDLVGNDGQPVEENYKVIRNASEVVVGNVPANLGEAYFLYLFENWQPIAVSKMEFLPRTNLRFCHVYFKKAQDAEDVEREFDGYTLQETSLVVMRPSTLQNEAF